MKIEDRRIYFKNEEELPDLSFLGIGSHGVVYYYGDTVYKYFSFDLDETERDVNKYEYFQNIKLADFSFPQKLIFVGNSFYGYTMPFFKGHDLKHSPFKNSFSTLKKLTIQGEKSMKSLLDYKIKVDDFYTTNVILSNRLKFIDVDLYSHDKSFSRQECIDNNFMNLAFLCRDIIHDSLKPNSIETLRLLEEWAKPLEDANISYLEYFDIVQKNLSEMADEEVKTLSQGAKVLRKF